MESRQVNYAALVKKARKLLVASNLAYKYDSAKPETFVAVVEGTREDQNSVLNFERGSKPKPISAKKKRKAPPEKKAKKEKKEKKHKKETTEEAPPTKETKPETKEKPPETPPEAPPSKPEPPAEGSGAEKPKESGDE
jgi:hypothetical protein